MLVLTRVKVWLPIINLHIWTTEKLNIASIFSHRDLRCRTQRFLSGPFSPGVDISAQVLVVSNDGRLLFSGGHWDCSLRVTQLGKGKLVGRICRHIGELSVPCRSLSSLVDVTYWFVFFCFTKTLLLAWLWISVASTSSLAQGTHHV